MQLSVSTYSFSALMRDGMAQLDCIARAKEMGFDAVEIESIHAPEGTPAAEYAAALRDEARRCGIALSSFTTGADFLTGSGGDLDAEVRRLEDLVDIAAILGVPTMRHDATRGFAPGQTGRLTYDDALPRLAEGCRRVTRYAAGKGIRTMTENHGFFSQDSVRVEKLLHAVGEENFGLLVDIGNFLCADEDPAQAVGRVAPYAFYVHAKDFHIKSGAGDDPGAGFFRTRAGNYLRGAILGHGNVPVRQCLGALRRAGFDGTVAIEFEGMEDPMKALPVCLQNLRRYLAD